MWLYHLEGSGFVIDPWADFNERTFAYIRRKRRKEILVKALKWLLLAAVSGIIGNAAFMLLQSVLFR